ncbi:MAG: type II secretion system minor pseudopilin GspH, partial [Pseudomonadales bacterium]|nr:type II secretion system minor pseudopilin GspH [Pseudomonadales bacterium]
MNPPRIRGFTLFEVLVVLFIISIMSGIVVANMPSFTDSGDFDREARRLEVILNMAREEAMIRTREFGFKPEESGYRFYIYDDIARQWQAMEDRPFDSHELPAEFELSLKVEGDDFELSDAEAPPVLILSSGEMTPFELTIRANQGSRRTLKSDGYADLAWQ